MPELYRNPDDGLVREIAALRRDVDALKRMPSGRKSIGPPHLAIVPAARVALSGSQLIGSGASTTINWTTEVRDNAGLYDAGDNTKLTAPIAGLYLLELSLLWQAPSGGGDRTSSILLNGSTTVGASAVPAAAGTVSAISPVTVVYQMAAGEYITGVAFQNSGANLNVLFSLTYMSMIWLGNV